MKRYLYRLLSTMLAFTVLLPLIGIPAQGAGTPSTDKAQSGYNLGIALQASSMRMSAGKAVGFTVTYSNQTGTAAPGAYVQVHIPDSMEFVSAQEGGGLSDDQILWNLGKLEAQATGSLNFTLRVRAEAADASYASVAAAILSDQTVRSSETEDASSVMLLLYQPGLEVKHNGYLQGYPAGGMEPLGYLTRAEAAVMFSRIFDLESQTQYERTFRDLPEGYWAANSIEAAVKEGFLEGYPDDTFRPGRFMTRAEMAAAIAKCLNLYGAPPGELIRLSGFTDTGSHWAGPSTEALYRYGVVSGYTGGKFEPDHYITRAEAVHMLNRMRYRGPEAHAAPPEADDGHAWYFADMAEAATTHYGIYLANGTEYVVRYEGAMKW